MDVVKNADGKTVCCANAKDKSIEIVQKGFKTIIRFLPDDTYEVVNLPQEKH